MTEYTALIVEPRKHKALYFVLNNFLTNLSEDWSIIIFHGNKNTEYVTTIVDKLRLIHNKKITLKNLHIDNYNSYTYSYLFMTEGFYNFIPTETFLVFQTDCMILSENKDNINLFLKYDYVGAPWTMGPNSKISGKVGNGGLSLRKKSKMIEIIKSKGYKRHNEDIYFSTNINPAISYNVPTFEEAKKFAVETTFYDSPFGIHNCWKWLNKENVSALFNKYSEISELQKLQYNDV